MVDITPKNAIEVKNLDFFYGKFQGLKKIDLNIQENAVTAFIGPSGCGKTTLLRLIAGFEGPSMGHIHLDGADITNTPPNLRPINTVFQN